MDSKLSFSPVSSAADVARCTHRHGPVRQILIGAAILMGLVAGLSGAETARADVRLPGLFSDNMVLQQGQPAPVWGWADEGEVVMVEFRDQRVQTTASGGKWSVRLRKLTVGGPDTLTVTGKNQIELHNVLVGEVWVCSGQSNMEWALSRSFEPQGDIARAANFQIRLFTVPKLKAGEPADDVKAIWKECNPETVSSFSAVAYYFGRSLQRTLDVPVGLIHTSWGGSPAEVWMSRDVLENKSDYKWSILHKYDAAVIKHEEDLARYQKEIAGLKAQGKTSDRKPPAKPAWKPGELYNGMIAPLIPFAIKGAIWYQGESNASRAHQYRSLFPDLIRNWRQDWNQGDFPFLAVQLAPFKKIKDQPGESDWAELREAQVLATKVLPNVGLAVITDVGEENDIHPRQKEPVGVRLALAARGIAYGQKLAYSGPMYRAMKVESDRVILRFDHVGKGLEARGGELTGFAIAGRDEKFVWAGAQIRGNEVVVSSPKVPRPAAVRYGWADYPVVNLWNKDGLPASPFRTDRFTMITRLEK